MPATVTDLIDPRLRIPHTSRSRKQRNRSKQLKERHVPYSNSLRDHLEWYAYVYNSTDIEMKSEKLKEYEVGNHERCTKITLEAVPV